MSARRAAESADLMLGFINYGGGAGSFAGTMPYLDGTAKSCVGKVETRYCDPGNSVCDSEAPPCLSFGDQTHECSGHGSVGKAAAGKPTDGSA